MQLVSSSQQCSGTHSTLLSVTPKNKTSLVWQTPVQPWSLCSGLFPVYSIESWSFWDIGNTRKVARAGTHISSDCIKKFWVVVGQEVTYPHWLFCSCFQSFLVNAVLVSVISHDQFLVQPFPNSVFTFSF